MNTGLRALFCLPLLGLPLNKFGTILFVLVGYTKKLDTILFALVGLPLNKFGTILFALVGATSEQIWYNAHFSIYSIVHLTTIVYIYLLYFS